MKNKKPGGVSALREELAEFRGEFRSELKGLREDVAKVLEENEKNRTFRERVMGVLLLLGSSAGVALFMAALRALLAHGAA